VILPRRSVLIVGLAVLACWWAAGPVLASGHPTLQLRRTRAGTILVDSQGYTLYTFSRDSRNHDACANIAECLEVWPALTSAHPTGGAGIRRGLVGTIEVPGVGHQVTYDGHPLYRFVGDSRPGETSNINTYQSGGYWPAIAASGRSIR
jgi:predicted lipoprotein with Yx(FWY)xxD motif